MRVASRSEPSSRVGLPRVNVPGSSSRRRRPPVERRFPRLVSAVAESARVRRCRAGRRARALSVAPCRGSGRDCAYRGAQCSGPIGSLGPRLICAGYEGVNLSRGDRDYPYDERPACPRSSLSRLGSADPEASCGLHRATDQASQIGSHFRVSLAVGLADAGPSRMPTPSGTPAPPPARASSVRRAASTRGTAAGTWPGNSDAVSEDRIRLRASHQREPRIGQDTAECSLARLSRKRQPPELSQPIAPTR